MATARYDNELWNETFIWISFRNVEHTSNVSNSAPSASQRPLVSTLECILLSVFGTLVAVFFIGQMIVYLRYYTARRQSWSVRKKRKFMPRPSPEGGGSKVWAQNYEPYGLLAAHCRPGLKYSGRPTGMVYISDLDSSSAESPSDGSLKARDSRSTFSSVYVVDSRGFYAGRTSSSTSPEVAVELLGASRNTQTLLRGVGPAVPPFPPPPVTLSRACIGRSRTPLAIPTKCENPAYESESSDMSNATAVSISKCTGVPLSDLSSYSQYTALPEQCSPTCSHTCSSLASTGASYKYTPKLAQRSSSGSISSYKYTPKLARRASSSSASYKYTPKLTRKASSGSSNSCKSTPQLTGRATLSFPICKYTPQITRKTSGHSSSNNSEVSSITDNSCSDSPGGRSVSPVSPEPQSSESPCHQSTSCSLSPFQQHTTSSEERSRSSLLPRATSSPLSPSAGRSRSFRSFTISPISSNPSTALLSPHLETSNPPSSSSHPSSPEVASPPSGKMGNSDSSSLTSVSSLSELSTLPATLRQKEKY